MTPLRPFVPAGRSHGRRRPARRWGRAVLALLLAIPVLLGAADATTASAVAAAPSLAAQADAPTASISPQQATWGEQVRVTGAGWAPGTVVDLSLLPDTIGLGSASVADDGTFEALVTAPEVRASTDYAVTATGQGANGLFAFVPVPLTIVGPGASMTVGADTLGWDETTEVRGIGFLPGSRAQVHLMPDNIFLADAVVRDDRGFDVTVRIPTDLASSTRYQLVVTGAAADGQLAFVGAPLTVIGPRPAIEVTDALGGTPAVNVAGVRFRPGTTAVITLLPGSERLADAVVQGDGTFQVRVALPDEAAGGGGVLAVTGEGADHLFAYLVWEIGPLQGAVTVDPAAPAGGGSVLPPPRTEPDERLAGPALRFSLQSLLDRLRPVEVRPDEETGRDVLLALFLLALAVAGGWLLYHGLRSDLGPAIGRLAPGGLALPLVARDRPPRRPRRGRGRRLGRGGGLRGADGERKPMHPMVSGMAARLFSFGPTAIATFVASRLIIDDAGVEAFNGYSLAISLMLLVPLHDMGVGSAIASAYASHGPGDPFAERTVLTAGRIVGVAAAALGTLSLVLLVGDTWGSIVGPSVGDSTFFAFAMAVYAVSFVPALSQAMLLGVHKTHYSILVRTLFTPMALVLVVVVIVLGLHPRWFIVVPAVAQLLNNVLSAGVATRATGFSWSKLALRLPWRSRFPGERIRQIAGPRLIVSLTMPLALASDRIILSHRSTSIELTKYSIVLQIFGPIIALVAASAQPLWPIYVAARAKGERGPKISKVVLLFASGTLVACAGLTLIARPVGHLVGGADLDLGWALPLVASAGMVCGAISFPLNVTLTTPADLRFVAAIAVVAVPVNIGLSIWLAGPLGAVGPGLATVIVAITIQIIPALFYLSTRTPEQRGFHLLEAAPDTTGTAAAMAVVGEPGAMALAGPAGATTAPPGPEHR